MYNSTELLVQLQFSMLCQTAGLGTRRVDATALVTSTQLYKVLLWAYLLVVQVVPDGVRELGDNTTGTYSMHVCHARLAGRNPCVGLGGA